jgi:hypothetical protein
MDASVMLVWSFHSSPLQQVVCVDWESETGHWKTGTALGSEVPQLDLRLPLLYLVVHRHWLRQPVED